jgi:hypothetical protein
MKINILLAITFLSFIAYANLDYIHGIVGMTLRDGGIGCVCHNLEPTDSVVVWIEGPDSLIINQTEQYRIYMTGDPAVEGGFNVASYFGTLNSIDTLVSLLSGELTHSTPNPFVNDTVKWVFSYTAPDTLLTDTLYSVGNSVNGNGTPSQDKWNFGQNFLIHIIDNPVYVQNENLNPDEFVLYQNYPNPFNPSTNIRFRISDGGLVSLIVYDILGNEVAVLVNEDLDPGEYKVEFNVAQVSRPEVTSGVYFYKLEMRSFVETKKMILLK